VIVLLETVHADAEAILRRAGRVVLAPDPATLPDVDESAVVAVVTRGLGWVDADLLGRLPALRVVARCGAGLDNIDVRAADERGVMVVHAPGVTTNAVAEHAMLLTLALGRRVVQLATSVAAGDWSVRDRYEGFELHGRRMGVLGLGRIGRRVAELGRAFGMEVVAWSRPDDDPDIPRLPFDEVVSTSDVIQICAALTPETQHLVGRRALDLVRPGTLLVNTARGALVDATAVAEAIHDGRLGGYAADVWDPEPPPADECLLAYPRVIVTPHVAALTDTTYRELCVGPAAAVAAIVSGVQPDPAYVYRQSSPD
jgi:phosphoglycerate dehydrogenase-like enzyme